MTVVAFGTYTQTPVLTAAGVDVSLPAESASAAQTVKSDVPFHAGAAKYSAGAPADGRGVLTTTYNWSIDDGGPV